MTSPYDSCRQRERERQTGLMYSTYNSSIVRSAVGLQCDEVLSEERETRESFLCFSPSTERLDPALMSPLIPLKLNFNGLLLVALCVRRVFVCILLHSHFPLQVECLLCIVVATAQVEEDSVAADCHLLLVLLLQLKGALQVLIRRHKSQD